MYHLAIYNSKTFKKDYIKMMLEKIKTADIKISERRTIPYNHLTVGDYIFLKESGGPVRGCIKVRSVNNLFIENPEDLLNLLMTSWKKLGVEDETKVLPWYEKVVGKKYVTIFDLEEPFTLANPIFIHKRDRRSWVSNYILSSEEMEAFKEINLPSIWS
jgi:hypothetical protein